LARLGDHPLDCLKRLGTINAVRRIFDFRSAEDSEYGSASDEIVVREDPRILISSYAPAIQRAIHAGKIVVGMTTEQPILAPGYPRMDATPSIDSPRWTYWMDEDHDYALVCGSLRCLSHDLVCFANPYNGLFSRPVVVRLQAQTTGATEHDRRPRELSS
jgi:hypothetical protein